MSATMRRYMGRESTAENQIWEAVDDAIVAGLSVAEFLEVVREAWDDTLSRKMKADDAAWVKAKGGAS